MSSEQARIAGWPGRRLGFLAALLACFFLPALAFSQKNPDPGHMVDLGKMQTAQHTNERIAELALAESARQHDYVIGPGDLLGIEVFDVPELSRDVRVNESGFVSLPLIPVKVQAAGFTSFQFQDKLAELLQSNGLVSHPQITVTVKEQHSEPITVIGAVKTPLTVQAVHQMTLLQVLSQAGGITDDAGSSVLITRVRPLTEPDSPSGDAPASDQAKTSLSPDESKSDASKNTITINLNDLLDSGDPKYNIPLFGGDVVTVPHAGVIYAVGAVERPGGFAMATDRQQLTVLKIVSLAGGLTPTAKPGNAVILRQPPGNAQRLELPVDVKKILTLKGEDIPLQRNDILYVPDSTGKHALRRSAEIAIAIATGAAIIRVQ
jgi:polysaccharide export outer membrane protein